MRIHQLRKLYKNISTVGMKLRTYCKLLSQEQKERGSHVKFLLSCMDDCYQEVTSFSNIALPPDLVDLLDLDASMEGESSTIDSCLQGMKWEQQCIEEQWQMAQKEQHCYQRNSCGYSCEGSTITATLGTYSWHIRLKTQL